MAADEVLKVVVRWVAVLAMVRMLIWRPFLNTTRAPNIAPAAAGSLMVISGPFSAAWIRVSSWMRSVPVSGCAKTGAVLGGQQVRSEWNTLPLVSIFT